VITAEGTKRCSMCGEYKPITEFHRQTRGDGLAYRCKPCGRIHLRQRREKDPETFREYGRRWHEANPGKKAAFDRRYYERNGDKIRAKVLERYYENHEQNLEAARRKRDADRPRLRAYEFQRSLRRHYGITEQDYADLLAAQEGVCAICGKECATGKRLAVDHNHATGNVRGLLCQACNLALGQFRESRELLAAAIAYLEERG